MKKPQRVLVIDDNKLLVHMIADMFKAVEFDAEIATDYATGLFIAKQGRADLIIVDYHLGEERNGVDFVKEIRADPALKGVAIIGISGYKKGLADEFISAGANGFLEKPLCNPPLYLYALGIINEHNK